jgi:glycosyltransferase involved in cell wall biosynthesis
MAQKYHISELVLLDDASTDNSKNVILELRDNIKKHNDSLIIKTCFNEKNSGNVFKQWEKGIQMAESPYIWICEADDLSNSAFLETAMHGFNNEDVVLSYTNSKIINQNDSYPFFDNVRQLLFNQIREKRNPFSSCLIDGKTEIKNSLAYYNTIPNISAVVFKKTSAAISALKEAEKYKLSGDWIFYIMLMATGKIYYSPKALNYHRVSNVSVTANVSIKKRLDEMKDIHAKVQKIIEFDENELKKMRHYEEKLSVQLNKNTKKA